MARTSQWWRCNTTYPTDAKLRRAGPNGRLIWPHVCNAMKLQGGSLSDDDLDAFALADIYGGTEEQWADGIEGLKRIGWLEETEDGWEIPGWERYQPDGRRHSKARRPRKAPKKQDNPPIPDIPRESRESGDCGEEPGKTGIPASHARTPGRRPVPSRPVPSSGCSGDDLSPREDDGDDALVEHAGRIERIRERLGFPQFISAYEQERWLGIAAEDPVRLDGLVSWAETRDDPARAFLNCIDRFGRIKTSAPARKPIKPVYKGDIELPWE